MIKNECLFLITNDKLAYEVGSQEPIILMDYFSMKVKNTVDGKLI